MTSGEDLGAGAADRDAALDLLAFAPHPDDVELFCGGTVAAMARRGYRVGVIDLTRGERASRGDVAIRAAEAAAAAEVLGLTLRANLGLPDTGLRADDEAQIRAVVRALRRHRPELVLAPWRHDRHPDHTACHGLVERALLFAGLARYDLGPDDAVATDGAPALPPHRPRQVLYYPMRELAEPTLVVDISDDVVTKCAAIACHASQVGVEAGPAGVGTAGRDHAPTLLASSLSMAALDARDRMAGALIGTAYGEPFVSPTTIGLRDPIAFGRANAFAEPLFRPERR